MRHAGKGVRGSILRLKALRQVHLGACLTCLFGNTESVRYQIQEMIWIDSLSQNRHQPNPGSVSQSEEGSPVGCNATQLISARWPFSKS